MGRKFRAGAGRPARGKPAAWVVFQGLVPPTGLNALVKRQTQDAEWSAACRQGIPHRAWTATPHGCHSHAAALVGSAAGSRAIAHERLADNSRKTEGVFSEFKQKVPLAQYQPALAAIYLIAKQAMTRAACRQQQAQHTRENRGVLAWRTDDGNPTPGTFRPGRSGAT